MHALRVAQRYHGQGVGRQLFTAVAARLRQEGFICLVVWVLAENPARGFYERLGGELVDERRVEWPG